MIWDPFEELRKMHDEMDRLFGRVFKPLGSKGKELTPFKTARVPVSNIRETEKNVIADIELPGIPRENIELNVNEDSIEIKAQKKAENEVKKKGVYSYHSSASQFYRKIPLPAEVKPEQASAQFKDGLLKVEIPKARQIGHKKQKRIRIK
ncbi:Hsp20/alpha crystallin family protein [Candidatus Woesearchaeota archaeon]|nr:Hsp20/alpha crystallin family protein [Candidatus Woesearchaeota archaeon]